AEGVLVHAQAAGAVQKHERRAAAERRVVDLAAASLRRVGLVLQCHCALLNVLPAMNRIIVSMPYQSILALRARRQGGAGGAILRVARAQGRGVSAMARYILLSTLTVEGRQSLHSRPERLVEVDKEIEKMGVKVIAQYAVLGAYDFISIVDAPDNETIA